LNRHEILANRDSRARALELNGARGAHIAGLVRGGQHEVGRHPFGRLGFRWRFVRGRRGRNCRFTLGSPGGGRFGGSRLGLRDRWSRSEQDGRQQEQTGTKHRTPHARTSGWTKVVERPGRPRLSNRRVQAAWRALAGTGNYIAVNGFNATNCSQSRTKGESRAGRTCAVPGAKLREKCRI